MGVENWSPFALRHAALRARDEDELVAVSARLRRLFLALLDAGLPPSDIGRVLTLQLDSIRTRWIDFAIVAEGPAPGAWAWLVLGSAARREFTLGSDQENALAYADTDDPEALAWYERFATRVNEGLERSGFVPDLNKVLARYPQWRMSQSAWLRTFAECLEQPDNSHLIRATVSFDFRHGSGGLEIVRPLVAIIREAPRHPGFLRLLARTTEEPKPALGFRGALAVAKHGEESGKLDIKRNGIIPVVNLARFHAIANGITISSTHDRLVAVEDEGALEPELAAGLREALAIIAADPPGAPRRADRGGDDARQHGRPRPGAAGREARAARGVPRRAGRAEARRRLDAAGPLALERHEVHRHRRAPAHAVGLLGPQEVGDHAVARRLGGHHDHVGADRTRLRADPLRRLARADDLALGVEAALAQRLDRGGDEVALLLPLALVRQESRAREAVRAAVDARDAETSTAA